MQNPLVSILTPFKNTAPFLKACLESIINQTYEHWELLIVDDHSSDTSYEVVEAFAKKDSRIKLFKNTGNGIIEALRIAFKNSQGDMITRMDSDDIMTPEKLEVLINNLIQAGPGNIAVGQVKYFAENGVKPGYKRYENWLNQLTQNGDNFSEIYKECVIPSPNWMAYRGDLIKAGAFDHYDYPEDYDLTFRFYKAGYNCIPCNTVLHLWRDYSSRTSRTHVHYAQNYFLNIKMKYFLDIDHDPNKNLVIWGAGYKGKKIAKHLLKEKVPFDWVCDNPKKIGKTIYGKTMKSFEALKSIENAQSIITVANTKAQKQIRNYLNALELKPVEDYIFVC
ncbi:glycosyltransferase family 2 protein [Gaetbulibacter aestuarii]|uniref:Glycosyltransferase family 2 protein n=1 Tax=Gaetbulibacter aestuarii TaxID=1502358 RepID=A0ABW7N1S6_9FLAO